MSTEHAADKARGAWTAGHDGTGKWGIYHGNETKKGWSGKGRLLIDGLSESKAKAVEQTHNASINAERERAGLRAHELMQGTNYEKLHTEIQQLREQLDKQGWLLLDANKRLAAAQAAIVQLKEIVGSAHIGIQTTKLLIEEMNEVYSDTTALDAANAADKAQLKTHHNTCPKGERCACYITGYTDAEYDYGLAADDINASITAERTRRCPAHGKMKR
jgi:hypothetical protein